MTCNLLVCSLPSRRLVSQARSVEVKEVEFNKDFITRMMQRLEWRVVKEAAVMVSPLGGGWLQTLMSGLNVTPPWP